MVGGMVPLYCPGVQGPLVSVSKVKTRKDLIFSFSVTLSVNVGNNAVKNL